MIDAASLLNPFPFCSGGSRSPARVVSPSRSRTELLYSKRVSLRMGDDPGEALEQSAVGEPRPDPADEPEPDPPPESVELLPEFAAWRVAASPIRPVQASSDADKNRTPIAFRRATE